MAKSKPVKRRGRPPKYALDEDGKEIVGLSYNSTNNMYYATGTNPRQYICSGNCFKSSLRRQFKDWRGNSPSNPEEIEEQKKRHEIHKQAVRLIEEGFLDDLIEKKAREIIKDDNIVKAELLKRAKELAIGERSPSGSFDNNRFLSSEREKFEEEIKSFAIGKAKEHAEIWIQKGWYDKYIWERAYDLITKDPIRAAKFLGIKEIAYVRADFNIPLSWTLAWEIFYCHKDESQFRYDREVYYTIKRKMTFFLQNSLFSEIKEAELYDALTLYAEVPYHRILLPLDGLVKSIEGARKDAKELNDAYTIIPMMDRLEILEDVFETVKNAGYYQVIPILELIKKVSHTY